jgi:hypothetical protein
MANAIVNFFKHAGGTLGLGGVGAVANAARSAYNYNPEEDEKLGATPVAGRLGAAASGALVGGATGLALQGGDYALRGIGRKMMSDEGLKAYDAVNPNRPKTLFGALRQGFQTVAGGDVKDFEAYSDSVMDVASSTPTLAVQRQKIAAETAEKVGKKLPEADRVIHAASQRAQEAKAVQGEVVKKWQATPAVPASPPTILTRRLRDIDDDLKKVTGEIGQIDTHLANAPTLTPEQMEKQATEARNLMRRRARLAKGVGLDNNAHDADIQKLLTDPKEQAEIGTITSKLNNNQAHLNQRRETLNSTQTKLKEELATHKAALKSGAKVATPAELAARKQKMADLESRIDPTNPENFEGADSTNPFKGISQDSARQQLDEMKRQTTGTPAIPENKPPEIKYAAPQRGRSSKKATPPAAPASPPLPMSNTPAGPSSAWPTPMTKTQRKAETARLDKLGPAFGGGFPSKPPQAPAAAAAAPAAPSTHTIPGHRRPRPSGKGGEEFSQDYEQHAAAVAEEAEATEQLKAAQNSKKKLLEQQKKNKPIAENPETSKLAKIFGKTDKNAMVDPGALDAGGAAMQDIGRIGAGAVGMAAGAPIYFGRYAARTYKDDVLKPYEERNTESPTVAQRQLQLQDAGKSRTLTAAEQNESSVLEQYRNESKLPGRAFDRINRSYEFDPAKPGIHTVTPAAKPGKPATAPAGVPIRPAMNTGFMSDNALMFGLGGAGAAAGFIGAATKASAYGAPSDHPINVLSGATKQNISAEAQMQADQSNRVRMTNPSMMGLNDADELYFQNPSLKPTRSRSRPGQYNDDGNLTLALSALRRG